MSSPSSRFVLEPATDADASDLAAIYGSDEGFEGDVGVRFTRGSNPLASLRAEGDVVAIALRDVATGQVVGMGACVARDLWANGRRTRVGYLTGLKSLPRVRRGTAGALPEAYAMLRRHTADVEVYYTTILESNTLARRLLERRRPKMPEYRLVGGYAAHCFRVGRRHPGRLSLTGGTWAELQAVRADASRFNLAPVDLPVPDAGVRLLRDRDQTPLAGCVVWDPGALKEYTITGYGGWYARASRLPVHWLGWPRLPRVGVPANRASLGVVAARGDDVGLLRELLLAVGYAERRRDFLMLGLADGHPHLPALRKLHTVPYRSLVYTVHFDADAVGLDDRPLGVEVGLL